MEVFWHQNNGKSNLKCKMSKLGHFFRSSTTYKITLDEKWENIVFIPSCSHQAIRMFFPIPTELYFPFPWDSRRNISGISMGLVSPTGIPDTDLFLPYTLPSVLALKVKGQDQIFHFRSSYK